MNNFAKVFSVLAFLFAAAFPASAQFADQATYVATPGGAANAITLAVDNWNINRAGVPLRFLPSAPNTGATTVVVNGVGGAISLKKPTGNGLTNLVGGEINPTEVAEIVFDGTQWQLNNSPSRSAAPQGYLTPCQTSSPSPVSGCIAGNPIVQTDVVNATTLYYEGINGNAVPIFNGGQFVPTAVTEAQMTLILSGTANTANNFYDVCIYNNAGTPAIGTMPAWTNATTRSTAVGQVQGLWLNSATVTVTNNNVGTSVAASRCSVVATIHINTNNGQVSLTRNYGQNRRWDIFNFYNRQQIAINVGDSTASWTPTTIGPVNGNTANSAAVFTGLPEEPYDVRTFMVASGTVAAGGQAALRSGVGWNVTNATSGFSASATYILTGVAGANTVGLVSTGQYVAPPALGGNVVTFLNSAANMTVQGGVINNLMTILYRG